MLLSRRVAASASVLATMINPTPMMSAWSLQATNLLICSDMGTNTFPPMCPHFLVPISHQSQKIQKKSRNSKENSKKIQTSSLIFDVNTSSTCFDEHFCEFHCCTDSSVSRISISNDWSHEVNFRIFPEVQI